MENLFDILIGVFFVMLVFYMGYNITGYIKGQIEGNDDIIPEMAISTAYMLSLPGDMRYEISTNNFYPNQEIRFFFTENRVNSKIEIGFCEKKEFLKELAWSIADGFFTYISFGFAGVEDIAFLAFSYVSNSGELGKYEKANIAGLIAKSFRKAASKALLISAVQKSTQRILQRTAVRLLTSVTFAAGPPGILIGIGISILISVTNTIKKKLDLMTDPLAKCGDSSDVVYQKVDSLPLNTIGAGILYSPGISRSFGEFMYDVKMKAIDIDTNNPIRPNTNIGTVTKANVKNLEKLNVFDLINSNLVYYGTVTKVFINYDESAYSLKNITIIINKDETNMLLKYNFILYMKKL